MVNSKKMSKSKVAVIMLSILLVLSLILTATGAWFTDSDSSTASQATSVTLGNIGSVTVTAGANVWKEHASGAAELSDVDTDTRSYVMPGDKLESGSVTFTYTADTTTPAPVYYVIQVGTSYYEFDGTTGIKVLSDNKCGSFSATSTCTLAGQVATVTVDSKVYALDGNITDKSTAGAGTDANPYESYKLPEIGTISLNSASFSITSDGVTYKIAIIQQANMSEATARTALQDLLNPTSQT